MSEKGEKQVGPGSISIGADLRTTYANGFALGLSNADVVMVLTLRGEPVEAVHLSYTLAKTLHTKLAKMIEELEAGVEREMLTTDEVAKLKEKQAE